MFFLKLFSGKSESAKTRRTKFASTNHVSMNQTTFSKDGPKIRADILNSIPLTTSSTPPTVSKTYTMSPPTSVDKEGEFDVCVFVFVQNARFL